MITSSHCFPAHIEYFRGLENPIGVKVGPSMRKGELVPLILTVCPNIKEQPGKVTLISRFGADNVETMLPAFIKEVQVSEGARRSSCVHLVGTHAGTLSCCQFEMVVGSTDVSAASPLMTSSYPGCRASRCGDMVLRPHARQHRQRHRRERKRVQDQKV